MGALGCNGNVMQDRFHASLVHVPRRSLRCAGIYAHPYCRMSDAIFQCVRIPFASFIPSYITLFALYYIFFFEPVMLRQRLTREHVSLWTVGAFCNLIALTCCIFLLGIWRESSIFPSRTSIIPTYVLENNSEHAVQYRHKSRASSLHKENGHTNRAPTCPNSPNAWHLLGG